MNALGKARERADAMYASDAASKALGIDIEVPAAGSVVATMPVRDDMVNGFGICHGGLVFALADTAFAFACNAYDVNTVAETAKTLNVPFIGCPASHAWGYQREAMMKTGVQFLISSVRDIDGRYIEKIDMAAAQNGVWSRS